MAKFVKRNGQYIPQDEASVTPEQESTLRGIASNIKVPTPTTPAAAASIGATPDQAKMAGLPNQVRKAVEERTDKMDELGATERYRQEPVQPDSAAEEARKRSEEIAGLANIKELIPIQIQKRIQEAQAQPVAPKMRESTFNSIVGSLPSINPDIQAKLTSSLARIASNPEDFDAIKEFTLLMQEGGFAGGNIQIEPGIDAGYYDSAEALAFDLADMYTDARDEVSSRLEKEFRDGGGLRLKDFLPSDMGFRSMADLAEVLDLDVETANELTIPEMEQRIAEIKAETTSVVNELREQYNLLPPGSAQAQEILQQLGRLGEEGVIAAEQVMTEAEEYIDTDDVITIGEDTFSLDEIFADGEMSSLIKEYLSATGEAKDAILPPEIYGGLREWIDSNVESLDEFQSILDQSTTKFEDTQTEWDNLASSLNMTTEGLSELMGWDPSTLVTPEEMKQQKEAFAQTGFGAIALDPSANEEYEQIINKAKLSGDYSIFKNKTEQEILDGHMYIENLIEDSENGALVMELAGLTPDTAFVFDPSMQQKIDDITNQVETLADDENFSLWQAGGLGDLLDEEWSLNNPDGTIKDLTKWLPHTEFLSTNPSFVDMVRTGELNESNIDQVAYKWSVHGDKFRKVDTLERAEDPEDILNLLFPGQSLNSMNEVLKNLSNASMLRVAGAQDKFSKYKSLFDSNNDNKIDESDILALREKVLAKNKGTENLSVRDILGVSSKDLFSIGYLAKPSVFEKIAPSDYDRQVGFMATDNSIDEQEFMALTEEYQEKLLTDNRFRGMISSRLRNPVFRQTKKMEKENRAIFSELYRSLDMSEKQGLNFEQVSGGFKGLTNAWAGLKTLEDIYGSDPNAKKIVSRLRERVKNAAENTIKKLEWNYAQDVWQNHYKEELRKAPFLIQHPAYESWQTYYETFRDRITEDFKKKHGEVFNMNGFI